MPAPDETVLQILTDVGLVTSEDLQQAKARAAATGAGLVQTIIDMGRVTEMGVAKALASQFGLETVNLPSYELPGREIPADVLAIVPREVALHAKIIPVFKRGDTLTVAIADPLDVEMVQKLGELLKMTIQPVVSCPTHIALALRRYYGGEPAGGWQASVAATSKAVRPVAFSPAGTQPLQDPATVSARTPDKLVLFAGLAIVCVYTALASLALISLAVAGSPFALLALAMAAVGWLGTWTTASELFRKRTPVEKLAAKQQMEDKYPEGGSFEGVFGVLICGIFLIVCISSLVRAGWSFFAVFPLVGALVTGTLTFRMTQAFFRKRKPEQRELNEKQRRPDNLPLLFVSRALLAIGFCAFLSPALFATGLFDWLPKTLALPLAELKGIVVDAKGQIYCGSGFYKRIQVYDPQGHFMMGWFIAPGSSQFRMRVNNDGLLEVASRRSHWVFNERGEQLSVESNGSDYYDKFGAAGRMQARDRDGATYELRHPHLFPTLVRVTPYGGETILIRAPLYLWPITGPAPAWLTGVAGMLMMMLTEKKKQTGKKTQTNPA